jgi:UDP-N-acetylmuramyl pentapeptide phosphotransferase/UDP-N-acetylglucosamine-1-phosphate transferase
MTVLVGGAVAFAVATALTPILARGAHARGWLDVPNDRSLHSVSTPRIGGIAMIAAINSGFLLSWALGANPGFQVTVLIGIGTLVGILGFIDDVRPLSALVRLSFQSVIAAVTVAMLGETIVPWLPTAIAVALTVVWVVALTNAFNFMDGIDGIAAAHAVVAGLLWAAIGAIAGWRDTTLIGSLVAAASAGFLRHNWHPARVFMGDAGSGYFGFLFAALPLTVPHDAGRAWGYALLIMWPFLFDTGFTLARRLSRGENVFAAHRSHLYQRLTLTEMSHARVVIIYVALASLGALAALFVAMGQRTAAVLSFGAISLAALCLWRAVASREAVRTASRGNTWELG